MSCAFAEQAGRVLHENPSLTDEIWLDSFRPRVQRRQGTHALRVGVKVPITTTHNEGLVVDMRSMPGNPEDAHTLADALERAAIRCDATPEVTIVGRGYKGVSRSMNALQGNKYG